jgi:hypothetical protein
MQQFIIKLCSKDDQAGLDLGAECFFADQTFTDDELLKIVQAAHLKGRLILTDSAQRCLQAKADGVILDLSKSEDIAADYRRLSAGLKGRFIGAVTRNRRHEAMLVSECEPDFVIFRAWSDGADIVRALTSWYQEFFLIQSALLPMDSTLDPTTFDTDFVVLDEDAFKKHIAKS